MVKKIRNISVLGDGGWGTTLAVYLSQKGYNVTLWGAFPGYVQQIRKTRINSRFLPGIKIPSRIKIVERMQVAVSEADLLVLAFPSQFARSVLKKVKKFDLRKKCVLSVIKGIDNTSFLRMSEIIRKELGNTRFAVLSGPTIAREVAQGIPSTAVIASTDRKLAKALQTVFNSNNFRIYTNSDVVGVELGGSIKNIIAIACGVCDGLGFGTNTKAAILSRGLTEMSRLGKTMGGKAETFAGLSGLGDLVTTCISPQSRNRYVGEQLGKGKSIRTITAKMDMVAEGIATSKAVYRLSRKYKVSMPITAEVYRMIYQGKKAEKAVADLMTRRVKSE